MTAKLPRICVVAHSADLYGADRCLHASLPDLLKHFRVTIATPSGGPGVAVLQALGAEVIRLPDYALRRRHLTAAGLLPWLLRLFSSVRTLTKSHRDDPFCVIYSNTLAAGIGPLLRWRWRIPHAVHVHECPNEPTWLPGALLRVVDWSTQVVICNSNYSCTWVRTRRPQLAQRTVVVHNGLDLVPAPAAAPKPHTPFTIACVARIHPKKGHPVLFEALRMAKERGRDWKVQLFGDTLDEYMPLYEELIRYADTHGLAKMIEWRGFVADVQIQYADADLAVVPSVIPEEFSLVCLEAQSMLLPVIATGPGGASEVLVDGKTGVIVAPGNARELCDAICRLEDDAALRATMGLAGRQRAETTFSREAFANGICDQILALSNGASVKQ